MFTLQLNSRGFTTDNQTLLDNWNSFKDLVLPSAHRTYLCNNYFSNLYEVKNELKVWLWDKIKKEIPNNPDPKLCFRNTRFSGSTAEAIRNLQYNDPVSVTVPQNEYLIQIIYVKRGLEYIKKLAEKHIEKRMPGIETMLNKDRYHLISVLKSAPNIVTILTNRWEPSDFDKVMTLLPAFFDDMAHIPNNPNSEARKVIKALFENNIAYIEQALIADCAKIQELAEQRKWEDFEKNVKNITNRALRETRNALNHKKARLEEYTRSIQDQLEEIERLQRLELGYLHSEGPDLRALHHFLKNNKNISLVTTTEQHAVWDVQTPILNYNKKDVEMYFKNEGTILNDNGPFAHVIRETFINEKYRLLTKQRIYMPWENASWNADRDTPERHGNQHITAYNCYTNCKISIKKALTNNDLILACNLIISTCATFTFTDHPVVTAMVDKLKGMHFKTPLFQEVETGTLYSLEELYNKYNEEHEHEEYQAI